MRYGFLGVCGLTVAVLLLVPGGVRAGVLRLRVSAAAAAARRVEHLFEELELGQPEGGEKGEEED